MPLLTHLQPLRKLDLALIASSISRLMHRGLTICQHALRMRVIAMIPSVRRLWPRSARLIKLLHIIRTTVESVDLGHVGLRAETHRRNSQPCECGLLIRRSRDPLFGCGLGGLFPCYDPDLIIGGLAIPSSWRSWIHIAPRARLILISASCACNH